MRQTDTFEGSVVSPLNYRVIKNGVNDLLRYFIAAGDVINNDRIIIDGDAGQQYFKAIGFGVLIGACFLYINI